MFVDFERHSIAREESSKLATASVDSGGIIWLGLHRIEPIWRLRQVSVRGSRQCFSFRQPPGSWRKEKHWRLPRTETWRKRHIGSIRCKPSQIIPPESTLAVASFEDSSRAIECLSKSTNIQETSLRRRFCSPNSTVFPSTQAHAGHTRCLGRLPYGTSRRPQHDPEARLGRSNTYCR